MRNVLLALSFAISSALAPSASAQSSDPAPSAFNIAPFANECADQRAAAARAQFGPAGSVSAMDRLDASLTASPLASTDTGPLMETWRAASEGDDPQSQYLACLYQQRIRALDPNARFEAEADIFANLPRQSGASGATILAESLDPAQRAARQQRQVLLAAQRETERQQRAQARAQTWSNVLAGLETLAVVAGAYVEAQNQIEQSQTPQWPSQSQQSQQQAPVQGSNVVHGSRMDSCVQWEEREQQPYWHMRNNCTFHVSVLLVQNGVAGTQYTLSPNERTLNSFPRNNLPVLLGCSQRWDREPRTNQPVC